MLALGTPLEAAASISSKMVWPSLTVTTRWDSTRLTKSIAHNSSADSVNGRSILFIYPITHKALCDTCALQELGRKSWSKTWVWETNLRSIRRPRTNHSKISFFHAPNDLQVPDRCAFNRPELNCDPSQPGGFLREIDENSLAHLGANQPRSIRFRQFRAFLNAWLAVKMRRGKLP